MKCNIKTKQITAAVILLVYLITLLPAEKVQAEDTWPKGPLIETPNAIVMEVNTGTVLYEKNSHEKHYPASITKVLTTLLAVENCSMDETVTFSEDAVFDNEGDTSHISRDVGEEMTMEQCLYAVMLASANECAYAVAEHVAAKKDGDYSTFIDMMNERAKQLGCKDTHFNNCNGLPDPEHWTTAYDMALIAREAYQNETFRIICGTGKYTIPPTNKHSDETPMVNHHNMLYPFTSSSYLYSYCKGGKTGYTTVANSTLVTYAENNGMTLVCVVMNTNSPNQFKDTITLMDYCFDKFQTYNISENETNLSNISENAYGVLNHNAPFVTLDTNAYIVLPQKVQFGDADFQLDKAEQGSKNVAELKYTYEDREVGSANIVASNAKVDNSLFGENTDLAASTEDGKIIIRPVHIMMVVLILVGVALTILVVKKLSDSFYIMKHERQIRRMERERYTQIKKKHRRRKSDRLFR